jgi:hypothetical protein
MKNRRMVIKESDTISASLTKKDGTLVASMYDGQFASVGQVIAEIQCRNRGKFGSRVNINNVTRDIYKTYNLAGRITW